MSDSFLHSCDVQDLLLQDEGNDEGIVLDNKSSNTTSKDYRSGQDTMDVAIDDGHVEIHDDILDPEATEASVKIVRQRKPLEASPMNMEEHMQTAKDGSLGPQNDQANSSINTNRKKFQVKKVKCPAPTKTASKVPAAKTASIPKTVEEGNQNNISQMKMLNEQKEIKICEEERSEAKLAPTVNREENVTTKGKPAVKKNPSKTTLNSVGGEIYQNENTLKRGNKSKKSKVTINTKLPGSHEASAETSVSFDAPRKVKMRAARQAAEAMLREKISNGHISDYDEDYDTDDSETPKRKYKVNKIKNLPTQRISKNEEEWYYISERMNVDWETNPARAILCTYYNNATKAEYYVILRKGLPFHQFGLLPVIEAKKVLNLPLECPTSKRLNQEIIVASDKPYPLTAKIIQEFEDFQNSFEEDKMNHMDRHELDLEPHNLLAGSTLESCAFLGEMRQRGGELSSCAKRDICMRVPCMATCKLVQRMISVERDEITRLLDRVQYLEKELEKAEGIKNEA